MNKSKQNQDFIKLHNKQMVLDLLISKAPVSRADLTKLTKMSATSISRIVAELCEQGLVIETGLSSRGVGRTSVMLEINPQAVYAIGVELDRDIVNVALVDFSSRIMLKKTIVHRTSEQSVEDTLQTIHAAIRSIVGESGINPAKLIGVGVGIPGIIDFQRKRVVFSPQLGWSNVLVAEQLQRLCGYSVVIDNELKLRALAEYLHGTAKGAARLAVVGLGNGVGSALVVDGKLYRGDTNSAGELGHTTIDPNGTLCECGRRGCLQTYIANGAVLQEARKIKPIERAEELYEAAARGESWTIGILDRVTTYIGITISNIACMYNPDTIVLCGSLIEQFPALLQDIERKYAGLLWQPFAGTFALKLSALKDTSASIGAATLVFQSQLDLS